MNDKIILVVYLGCQGLSKQRTYELMSEARKILSTDDGDSITHFIIPSNSTETRVECINPKLITGDEYAHVNDVLVKCQADVDKFISDEKLVAVDGEEQLVEEQIITEQTRI